MPFTALHAGPLWAVWLRFPKRLDFVALTIGAVIPDLFEPVLLVLGDPNLYWAQRDWSHSLLGAFTYDLVLAIVMTTFVARPLLYRFDRMLPSPLWSRFGGRDYRTSGPRSVVLLSAAIGTVSHVLLDVPFHPVSPLLFPAPRFSVVPPEYENLVFLVSGAVFAVFFLYLLYEYWLHPTLSRSTLDS